MRGMRYLELGIEAINGGNRGEGARLLRLALRDETLAPVLRATVFMWMAETTDEREFKIKCYNDALIADPGNSHATQRLSLLLAPQMPPASSVEPTIAPPPIASTPQVAASPVYPAQPTPAVQSYAGPTPNPLPYTPPAVAVPAVASPFARAAPSAEPAWTTALFYRTVGIVDGPHGPGTAFFINTSGLLATTRYVVSGRENITVELEVGRQLLGRVVRSFVEFDLALVSVDVSGNRTLPFTRMQVLPENLDITAYSHKGGPAKGRVRATVRSVKAGWFPTTIRALPDAGGDPVFDERNELVGMLGRNAGRSADDVFGLHIDTIRALADKYQIEASMDARLVYCPGCGSRSRAALVGGYYCENCGTTLPEARSLVRTPHAHAETIYGEAAQRPCPHPDCRARVGYHKGFCLRCGREPI
jgi:hypothetical protein